MKTFNDYIDDVYAQLCENASSEYSSEHITYNYSTKLINEHLEYFQKCYEMDLSAYKALLFFYDHLHGNYLNYNI